ncbi:MAG: 50S ribosomal protein L6, partial [Actinomycetota bacterium]
MSRIGKQPIAVPGGVDVTLDGPVVRVKGPKGQLEHTLVGGVNVARDGDALVVTRIDDSRSNRSLHGLQRTLIANMVTGVSEGFVRELDIVGVGYRANAQGSTAIELALGFSHPV